MPKQQHQIKMFEISVIRGVEGDDDGHLLAERKSRRPLAVAFARFDQSRPPQGLENLAKIVHVAKQFRKVHLSVLSIFASLPETVERILFCANMTQ